MLKLKTGAVLCATLFVLAAPVQAADHALTEKKIEAFDRSDIAVGVWLDMLSKQVLGVDRPHSEMEMSTLVRATPAPYGRALRLARELDLEGDLSEIVADYGFKDASEWAEVGDRIARAHVSLSLDNAAGAWSDIESVGADAPAIDSELIAAIKDTAKRIKAVSAADKAAVKAYIAKGRAAQ